MALTANPAIGAGDIEIRVPVKETLPWIAFVGLLALIILYFVSSEQGATALISGGYVHEFVHDGRHLLGFPCH